MSLFPKIISKNNAKLVLTDPFDEISLKTHFETKPHLNEIMLYLTSFQVHKKSFKHVMKNVRDKQ